MTKILKTLVLSTALATGFLSAGAFAGNQNVPTVVLSVDSAKNMTVIYKNSTWPLSGQMTMDACKVNRCQEV